jgi:hypothetical protein
MRSSTIVSSGSQRTDGRPIRAKERMPGCPKDPGNEGGLVDEGVRGDAGPGELLLGLPDPAPGVPPPGHGEGHWPVDRGPLLSRPRGNVWVGRTRALGSAAGATVASQATHVDGDDLVPGDAGLADRARRRNPLPSHPLKNQRGAHRSPSERSLTKYMHLQLDKTKINGGQDGHSRRTSTDAHRASRPGP